MGDLEHQIILTNINFNASCMGVPPYYIVQYSTIHYSTVQYITVQLHYSNSTIHYSTVQYITVQYNTLQYSTLPCPCLMSHPGGDGELLPQAVAEDGHRDTDSCLSVELVDRTSLPAEVYCTVL